MPIKISSVLDAYQILKDENVAIVKDGSPLTRRVRPLQVGIVNLMPTKQVTETQLLRLLANSSLQVEVEFIEMVSHRSKNTSRSHLDHSYKTFEDIRGRRFDGLIVTGAPIETLPFEEVEYWEELSEIFAWSETHVTSTLHICWGALADLHYHYGITKYTLPEKLFGVYPHIVEKKDNRLLLGADDVFYAPHSRHATCRREEIEAVPDLEIVASSDEAGVHVLSAKDYSRVYIMGHCEYDRYTLDKEYRRDKDAGLPIHVPVNYYPGDDDTKPPVMNWRAHANLLYYNWLNYCVFRSTT